MSAFRWLLMVVLGSSLATPLFADETIPLKVKIEELTSQNEALRDEIQGLRLQLEDAATKLTMALQQLRQTQTLLAEKEKDSQTALKEVVEQGGKKDELIASKRNELNEQAMRMQSNIQALEGKLVEQSLLLAAVGLAPQPASVLATKGDLVQLSIGSKTGIRADLIYDLWPEGGNGPSLGKAEAVFVGTDKSAFRLLAKPEGTAVQANDKLIVRPVAPKRGG